MTREEAIEILEKEKFYMLNHGGDSQTIALDMAIKALEKENSDRQRYVVRGINNDKIEFVDKYSVRAFNRYVEFIAHDKNKVLDKIRAEIIAQSFYKDGDISWCTMVYLGDVLDIIDSHKTESER